ncbi:MULTISPECIES: hypothetical protein [Enterococcus]|uniref:Uncharacterized protein n=1 Tax=Enterococcus sulfureus ATCC 49903 TaxID=1140003 RepID=S0KMD9_9ENTE|nr:hypothetical protein [Enterococcus sulfureus]EOT45872.1 hypothetical protein OMY_01893 [Enterococcus sulfureus ATCC 49903]EOT83077.1 hypothetical protein I573_02190 [Enterococcus sulfureus ATCC 49903]
MKKLYRKCTRCSFSVYLALAVYSFLIGMFLTLLDSSQWLYQLLNPTLPMLFHHAWCFPLGMFLRYLSLVFLAFSLILVTFINKIE